MQSTASINNAQTSGNKIFQPSAINWSYLKRGKVARTHINKKITNHNFNPYQIHAGTVKGKNEKIAEKNGIGSQPPRKIITNKFDITITCKYSPKNKKAKVIEEYSTLKPETNSDSASAKSNGAR